MYVTLDRLPYIPRYAHGTAFPVASFIGEGLGAMALVVH